MTIPEVQHARDYNRGLPWVVRVLHLAWAVGLWVSRPIRDWTGAPARRPWARPLVWGSLLALVIGRWDGALARLVADASPFGPGLSSVLLGLTLFACVCAAPIVWAAGESGGRMVTAWATGFITMFLACRVMPMVVGRPRPVFADPSYFISPFGQYPLSPQLGIRHAWEFWVPGISRLWSMPSREVAYAFFAAWTIGAVRPRWRVAGVIVAVGVGVLTLASGEHYASDSVVGATLGVGLGRWALRFGRPEPAGALDG